MESSQVWEVDASFSPLCGIKKLKFREIKKLPLNKDIESDCNAGDPSLSPGSGRDPGEANGNPLQFSCLENLMDRGTWKATGSWDHKSRTRLSTIFRQIATLHMIF